MCSSDLEHLAQGKNLQVSRDKNQVTQWIGNPNHTGPLHSNSGSWKEWSAALEILRQMVSTLDFHTHLKSLPGVGEGAGFLRHESPEVWLPCTFAHDAN